MRRGDRIRHNQQCCPECGELLVLRVGVAEPKQGTLIAGLVGLSAVAGFNALMLLIGVVESLVTRPSC
jgi:hypothetical protein